MNNEDMSDILKKLNNMINMSSNSETDSSIKQTDISSKLENINEDTIRNLINSFNTNNNNLNNESTPNNNYNFDINTILKIKKIFDKINTNTNDPRSNLLLSLKPYLNNDRKQKLDQYIQFLNISKLMEAFNSENGVDLKWFRVQAT